MDFQKFLELNREEIYKMADENTDKDANGVIVIKTNDEWRKEDDKEKDNGD
jgi:hypothetical protein